MGNRDFRIEAARLTPKEQFERYRELVGDHLISFKGLWPTPSDYAGLRSSWAKDLLAGVTVGVVALPLALGFGVASGVGAAAGLVTAIIAGVVAAVFGGSHLQVSGPTGAMTVVLLPLIAKHGVPVVPLLAIIAGVLVVVMALTAVGRAVEFIPLSVVEGFTIGIGVIIALQQIPLVLGTERGEAESTLVSSWLTLSATDWSSAWQPLLVAAGVIALHLIGHRFFRHLPLSLIAIVVATLAVELAGADVDRIGALPTGLPMPALPEFSLTLVQDLAAPALAVAALAALESLLSARVADGMRPDVTPTSPDRELMGQGLANIASGLFGGLPATGAIARTAVNVRSGAKTRVASVSHAVVLLAVMLLLAPL
ncbi:MAG TPA: SulP family inorganic anion transporter, partial [Propionicimonas sp.]|nr:SulP family inorganic anion transporter [Propionicimonas sp.]